LRASTEIVAFAPEHLAAVARFSEATWTRPRSEAYLRWRYLEPPFHRAYLALREGRCLAMVTAFRRPYRTDGEDVTICDAFDWYCLPELRNSGLGVRLMQRMMRDPEPVIVTGGTADTRAFLPRLGFRSLAEVGRYLVPLGAGFAADALRRRYGLPRTLGRLLFPLASPRLGARRHGPPAEGRVIPVAALGPEALAIDPRPGGTGCVPIWTPELLRWLLAGFPGMGHFLPLYFAVGERLAGWGLLRTFQTPSGTGACLLDLRAAPADHGLYPWMLWEAARRAAALGAGFLAAGTTCPALEAAFRRSGLRRVDGAPIHFYSSTRRILVEPLIFGSHWGDEPLVPYPSHWWQDPEEAPGPT
jgi:Acetyltransferase (GNAT) family